MGKSKKRIKKRDCTKLIKIQTPQIIDGTGIYELPESNSEFISFDNVQYNHKSLMRVYCNIKHKWTVALIVFKINSQGFKAIEVEHVQPPHPCLADEIADSVSELHNKMIGKCPENEYLAAGYLAIPRDEFLSSKAITDLFDKIGVWEMYITNNGYKLNGELTE